jgi:hypothetical protein
MFFDGRNLIHNQIFTNNSVFYQINKRLPVPLINIFLLRFLDEAKLIYCYSNVV